jgi:DNA repair photolyase
VVDLIYAPKGQAGEYAELATNPYRGCGHGCAYCYVPKILFMDRKEFDAGATLRPGYLHDLKRQAVRLQAKGVTGQVMLSFTTDPYHPGDTNATRQTLGILRDHGFGFCTLTKGGWRSIHDLDLFRRDRDAYACTLTSLDKAFSLKWERNAALPKDRLGALEYFHKRGIFTWVSLEPTLDIEASLAIVEATHESVDLYKVGRVNYLPITKTTDWKTYTLRMIETLNRLGKAHYIKHDLQRYLPPGYANPLRVPQHY